METIEEKYIKLKIQRYEAVKRYRNKNKELISINNNNKYEDNKDVIRTKIKHYYDENKEKINAKKREKYQQYKNTDEWKLKNCENARKHYKLQKEKFNELLNDANFNIIFEMK